MPDFDSHISIEEISKSKDVECSVRELTIDSTNTKIETPIKVLSGKNISSKTAENFVSKNETPLFEITKFFDKAQYHNNLIATLEGEKGDWVTSLNNKFGLKRTLEDQYRKNIIVSSVFREMPVAGYDIAPPKSIYQKMSADLYQTYLDYVYSASSAFILTPDVYLTPSPNSSQINNYLKFIDFSIETLQMKNNKPIFAPLPIDLAFKNLTTVLHSYKRMGYTNIWIDFKAKPCSNSNSARLRTISRRIEEIIGDESVVYCSQIKRERDVTKTSVPALDIFPSFSGTDFLGVNRTAPAFGLDMSVTATRKGFSTVDEYNSALEAVKCSIFDAETYNYTVIGNDDKLSSLVRNVTTADVYNGIAFNKELNNIRDKVLNDEKLLPYLNSKEAVSKNAPIFDSVKRTTTPTKETDLSDFF